MGRYVLMVSAATTAMCLGGSQQIDARTFPTREHLTSEIFLELQRRAAIPEGTILRSVYNKGLAVSKSAEGWSATLYNDPAGYCTIAYATWSRRPGATVAKTQNFCAA